MLVSIITSRLEVNLKLKKLHWQVEYQAVNY